MSTKELLEKVQFENLEDAYEVCPTGYTERATWDGFEGVNGTFMLGAHKYVFTNRQEMPESGNYRSTHIALAPEGVNFDDPEVRKEWIDEDRFFHDEVFLYTSHGEFYYDVRTGFRYCKPCIACGKKLIAEHSTFEHTYNQPSGGTNFNTSGHYGSGVFDPMRGGLRLSINICDECMIAAGNKGWVEQQETVRIPVEDRTIYTDWNINRDPYGEDEDDDED